MADELFKVKIISPDRIFYEGEASMIELKTSEGEIGVYKNHIPMTTILVPGIVRITESSGVKKAALHAGFIEILQEQVTILAEVAEWPEEIDINRANEARTRAERRLSSADAEIDLSRAEYALRKSLTRLEVAKK